MFIEKMNRNEILMLAVNCIFNLCSLMASVFMNVYLYSYTGSLAAMAVYTTFRIGSYPFFFTIAGKLAIKRGHPFALTFGLLFLILQLAEVLLLNQYFNAYPFLIYLSAVICGMGESFYWCSNNSLNQLITTAESRAAYISVMGIFNNIMSIAAPVLSGIIIANSTSDTAGYIRIFQIVFIIYVILAIIAFQVKVKVKPQNFHVIKCLKLKTGSYREHFWKVSSINAFLFGINNSLSLMLAGLLIYNATGGSGSLYSQLLSGFAVITILGYAYCSRKMKAEDVMNYYTISSWGMAVSSIVLVIVPNLYGALFYGVVNAIASPFFWNAYSWIGMEAVDKYKGIENITGRVIAREIFLAAGRCTGMILIVLAYNFLPENIYLQVSVIAISLFAVVTAYYTKHSCPAEEEGKVNE
jgi:MFS family permease